MDQEVASPAQLSSMIGDEGDYPVSKTEYDSLYNEYAQLLVKERSGVQGHMFVNCHALRNSFGLMRSGRTLGYPDCILAADLPSFGRLKRTF